MPDLTKGAPSLTTFLRNSREFMKQLKRSKRPVVLTVKGKDAVVVQDAEVACHTALSLPNMLHVM